MGGVAAAVLATAAVVVGDGIPQPLTGEPGDAARGRALVADRQAGLCLLCHSGPFEAPQAQGTLAGDLRGAGSRWTAAQLRLRVADARALNPASPMPSLHTVPADEAAARQARVAPAWRGRPVLNAQQVEDVVAFLQTLR